MDSNQLRRLEFPDCGEDGVSACDAKYDATSTYTNILVYME